MEISVTPSEEALVREVLRVARTLQGAGGFEVRLRPGWTPLIMKLHREPMAEHRPLNDSDSQALRDATRRRTG